MNLRLYRIDTPGGPAMAADFQLPDGRKGSVSVLLIEYERCGETALLDAVLGCAEQRARDNYVPPQADRFSELP